jgi:hypothetical protein
MQPFILALKKVSTLRAVSVPRVRRVQALDRGELGDRVRREQRAYQLGAPAETLLLCGFQFLVG